MKIRLLCLVALIFIQSTIGCAKVNLDTDKAKYSYAIGVNIGNQIKKQGVDIDKDVFIQAFADAIEGTKSQMSNEEISSALNSMRMLLRNKQLSSATENLKIGKDYLAKNSKKNGVKVTKSGLQYKVIKEGNGGSPKVTNTVKVHYRGTLIDGKEFDSSYKRKVPAEFPVNRVIPGWTEALQLMKVGAKYELTIPSELAYGERGNSSIPGNSVLIFEVELLEIKK